MQNSKSDIIIINSGAHLTDPRMSDKFLQWRIDSIVNFLFNSTANTKRKQTLIWRTSPVGHPFCKNLVKPFANYSQFNLYAQKYIFNTNNIEPTDYK